ncbi:MAG: plasma-membrane proton-efflux P-type ATPase [Thermoproteota archaeon]|nr:plasma-membrane proton-efflux P-type ATPase [Candidatus Brockarchaeota archaeon]MBO3801214.1 plasma-membrane proton-efflux P-type ATPase [Candidatus Brockarchaeota archaeon]
MEETLKSLNATEKGLSDSEAKKRLEVFGYNEVVEKKRNPIVDFLLRFWGPMPWLLELAAVLSFLLEHYLEGTLIFILLTVNAIIGHWHARGSQKAVELLKKKLAIKAKVLRDGSWAVKEAREIVPGDIISVRLGDVVPADAKIISGELSVDQSALTGESLPVDVHESDIIYSGSIVRRGEAICVVVNTGANTYFGKTTELVKIAKPKSHQEEIMMAIIKYMMYFGIVASLLVSSYALLIHVDLLTALTFVVTFLMGAVPVALPAVLTIIQAVGAVELAKRGALVTRLDSVEDAASIDVLCLDKTGTITQNKLSVADVVPFYDYRKEEVVAMAALASREESLDLIDLAVLSYAKELGVNFSKYKQVLYKPFDPSTKRTEAVIRISEDQFKVVKGAPQIIMSLCKDLDEKIVDSANRMIEEFSRKGYRTIAVAKSEGNNEEFKLLGLLALADPPRPDSRSMIEEIKKLEVKPIMLTGDNIAIAKEVARQVGIGDNIVRLSDLEKLSEAEQEKLIEKVDGFAEIYPEDKYKIVKLLQSKGHMVGMTGDGVNDAPALKQAEMGIAVSNSTDVAKASASVVLTEPGIGVIVDLIKVSRQTYQRALSWVINKVTKVIEFISVLTISFFWLHDLVLSLLGMSLLVFANDFVTMSLATDNVEHTKSPNKWNIKNITLASLVPAIFLIIEGMLVIFTGVQYFHLNWEKLRSLVLLNLVFNSQFRVLIIRERRHFWSSRPGRELLITSTATIIVFMLLGISGVIIYPLKIYEVLIILGYSMLFTLMIDFPKYYVFRKFEL